MWWMTLLLAPAILIFLGAAWVRWSPRRRRERAATAKTHRDLAELLHRLESEVPETKPVGTARTVVEQFLSERADYLTDHAVTVAHHTIEDIEAGHAHGRSEVILLHGRNTAWGRPWWKYWQDAAWIAGFSTLMLFGGALLLSPLLSGDEEPADELVVTTTQAIPAPTTTTSSPDSVVLPPGYGSKWDQSQYGCHSDDRCLDFLDQWCDRQNTAPFGHDDFVCEPVVDPDVVWDDMSGTYVWKWDTYDEGGEDDPGYDVPIGDY